MTTERRKGGKPIPDKLDEVLSPMQMMALRQIESFGWQLRFVRRPLFQTPIVVVSNADGRTIGILEEDRRVNMKPDILLRD